MTYRASISISFAAAGRGTEQLRAISNSWRVVDRFLWLQTHLNAATRPGSSSAAIKPRISAIISSRTVAIISYCMSHCGFEGGNIPSDWNSISLRMKNALYRKISSCKVALHVHLTDYRVRAKPLRIRAVRSCVGVDSVVRRTDAR